MDTELGDSVHFPSAGTIDFPSKSSRVLSYPWTESEFRDEENGGDFGVLSYKKTLLRAFHFGFPMVVFPEMLPTRK